jgi:hypothetical protein
MSKNKHTNKNKKRRNNKTFKIRRIRNHVTKNNMTQHKMKGGAGDICDEISGLQENNIFNIFRSAVQLPKITLS